MKYLKNNNFQHHPYHMVSPSPWPIFTSISLFVLTTTGVLNLHGFNGVSYLFFIAIFNLMASMFFWFRDVISEGTYLGDHTYAVQRGINLGVGLFIVSEALFFLGIFWAFFHSSLSPNIEVGAMWHL
ncbi:cytochrome oxidase subunit III (mitochondrion) [Histoplasma capsulatum G186AR]|uniref:Cytochrome c oxidase subunit 3 n=1 Tax=Ajellomyces capsulatus (strain G186AR / H82 / ATCC MYA-2454 / RMSCC 2432) TaxID=447093 RepID=C0P1F9_AJECG|nr:cytochrome oxidase subunit III [Histoplasma capsulatum G186AR]EEH02513.1 cytochrome oxidase subunit III [Histoplasma capsulatum G186AR]